MTQRQVGDQLAYTLTYSNIGQDPAGSPVITDPLPAGHEYVPGSLETVRTGSGQLTDAAGDDRGEYSAGSPTASVRVGTGGTAVPAARSPSAPPPAAVPGDRVPAGRRRDRDQRRGPPTSPRPWPGNTIPGSAGHTGRGIGRSGVTKIVTPDPLLAGGAVTSTIVVRTTGRTPADTTLDDTLPRHSTRSPPSPAPGICSTAPEAMDCTFGTLALGRRSRSPSSVGSRPVRPPSVGNTSRSEPDSRTRRTNNTAPPQSR